MNINKLLDTFEKTDDAVAAVNSVDMSEVSHAEMVMTLKTLERLKGHKTMATILVRGKGEKNG